MLTRGRERARTRRQQGVLFSPRTVADLLAGWEAARLTELAPGAAVATWHDLSGHGRDATQTVPERRPTFVAGAVNDLPAVRFEGVNDALTGSTGLAPSSPLTVFVVANIESSSPSGRVVSLGTLTPGEELGIGADTRGTRLVLNTGAAPGSTTGERATTTSALGWQVTSLVYAPRQAPELRSNGGAALVFTTPSDGTVLNPHHGVSDPPFALGAAVGGVVAPSRVLLAAALLYGRALNDHERSQVERWLGARYGIPVT